MHKCTKDRIAPTLQTKLRLFADSGGLCTNPNCLDKIFTDYDSKSIHIAEVAHVISAGDKGPRSDLTTTPEERSEYSNLILLCANCHTAIDKAEGEFPVSLLESWKNNHKNTILNAFGIEKLPSRYEVRKNLEPFFEENKYIFEQYGPMTEERFNPESELPAQWLRKIREKILPNNRKILLICETNKGLLSTEKRKLLLEFQQHVDDFEAKHLGASKSNGKQFPEKFELIFDEE